MPGAPGNGQARCRYCFKPIRWLEGKWVTTGTGSSRCNANSHGHFHDPL